MVKTNKKSLIAMIAMVVLLIASIAMGITGAWFTATDKQESDGANLTFGSVSVSGTITGMEVKLNGADWTTVTTETVVMPGDMVRGGVATFTITTNDRAGVYYLIKSGEDYYTKDGKYESGDLTAVATSGTETITFGGIGTEGQYVGGVEGASVANTEQGQAASVTAGSYTIYVIQASNIAASDAASTIKGLVDAGFPANHVDAD